MKESSAQVSEATPLDEKLHTAFRAAAARANYLAADRVDWSICGQGNMSMDVISLAAELEGTKEAVQVLGRHAKTGIRISAARGRGDRRVHRH